MPTLSRRDFLKLAALAGASAALTTLRPRAGSLQNQKPNIVILLADTMSATNLSLYGYPRRTTPNLERLAQRAFVYHNHHSGGNYTTPGTATVLTGSYPWTHRAFNLAAPVRRSLANQNVFRLIGPDYHRAAFTQNPLADVYLRQFVAEIDQHIPTSTFILEQDFPGVSDFITTDPLMAPYAIDDFLMSTHQPGTEWPGSLSMGYLGLVYRWLHRDAGQASKEYPYGIPSNAFYYYENRTVYDGVRESILDLHRRRQPFFAYFHLMSPHAPYSPTGEFVDTLAEMDFQTKKTHILGNFFTRRDMLANRKMYDEYIANVDAEMGRLFDALEQEGVLENTYFIILSDHGEMFERGVIGHSTALLNEPIINTPLMILPPGKQQRTDIQDFTSNTDVLPTILSIAGQKIPQGVEGRVLPGFGGIEDSQRPIFAVDARESSAFLPLTRATMTMLKDSKKIIYYKGYKKLPDSFELYDLHDDAAEKRDIYQQDPSTAKHMKDELLENLEQAESSLRHE